VVITFLTEQLLQFEIINLPASSAVDRRFKPQVWSNQRL